MKLGGSPGLVVMGETNVLKVMGSNHSTVFWMDVFSHICCKNYNVCFKKDEDKNENEAGMSHF